MVRGIEVLMSMAAVTAGPSRPPSPGSVCSLYGLWVNDQPRRRGPKTSSSGQLGSCAVGPTAACCTAGYQRKIRSHRQGDRQVKGLSHERGGAARRWCPPGYKGPSVLLLRAPVSSLPPHTHTPSSVQPALGRHLKQRASSSTQTQPGAKTLLLLGVTCHLPLDQAQDLLCVAGFSLCKMGGRLFCEICQVLGVPAGHSWG